MPRCLLVLLALSLFACSGLTTEAPVASEVTPAAASAPPPTSLQAPPKLDKEEIQGVLQAWLQAQNDGDFDAYAGLYASRFYGVKRSGPRTYRYDRDGWLADRERMFRKQVTVQADDVEISASSSTAQIRFVQTWASGSYKDVGPKQLVVTRQDGELRLTREEMLASKIIGQEGGQGGPGDPGSFVFVEEMEGALWVLLEQEVDEGVGLGQPRLMSRHPSIVRKTADPGQLEAESTSMKGRVVVVYGDEGPLCKATVGELAVITRFYPHFGMQWYADGAATDQPPMGDQDVAAEIWDMGPKELWGRLGISGRGDCTGARWARDSSLPEVRMFRPAPQVAETLRPTAQKAFRKLPGYREIQQDFEKYAEDRGDTRWWDEYDGAGPVQLVAFADDSAGRTLVAAHATAGFGCGGFWGGFWAVWEVTGGGSSPGLKLLTDQRTPGDTLFLPDSAFDLEGDGVPELIDQGTLLQHVDGVHRTTLVSEMDSYDCPC